MTVEAVRVDGVGPGAPGPALLCLEQTLVYDYEAPIVALDNRLVVVPRARHGSQLRTEWSLGVSGADAAVRVQRDRFGNCVVDVGAAAVREQICFAVSATVRGDRGATRDEQARSAVDRRWHEPTPLTEPDAALARAAARLRGATRRPLDVAEAACALVHRSLAYEQGVTDVETTAAAAHALGKGVCQDFAHVMLALCRAAGVAARYVSGHLLGEGGSHAWVEVLTSDEREGGARATAFDPTHDRRTDGRYLTVAVGRDYGDVAPTSGTYLGGGGRLTVRKQLRAVAPAT